MNHKNKTEHALLFVCQSVSRANTANIFGMKAPPLLRIGNLQLMPNIAHISWNS